MVMRSVSQIATAIVVRLAQRPLDALRRIVRNIDLETLTTRDWISIGIGSALGAIGGYLLVDIALPFLIAIAVALLCAAPAAVLLWLGTLHGTIQSRAARRRADTAFQFELQGLSSGISADGTTPHR